MVITLRMSKELHARIKVMAKERSESMNIFCITAIDQLLTELEIVYTKETDKEGIAHV